jgi:hypothetical protein
LNRFEIEPGERQVSDRHGHSRDWIASRFLEAPGPCKVVKEVKVGRHSWEDDWDQCDLIDIIDKWIPTPRVPQPFRLDADVGRLATKVKMDPDDRVDAPPA